MAYVKKLFVIDTNVILHDSSCIYQFKTHDIIVPISVLEELDHFKKGGDTLNYHAREFVRSLDAMSGDKIFDGGVKIGTGKGKIIIKLDNMFHPDLVDNFTPNKPDHRILNSAFLISKENPSKQVILVTKDMNLRMKAKSVGLLAQDYTTDHVKDITELYTGNRIVENINDEIIESMYSEESGCSEESVDFYKELLVNEYLILKNQKKSALAVYDADNKMIKRVDKVSSYGITPKNAEQTFALNALLNNDIRLVSISGKAGTGKTLLALAAALELRRFFRQIYIARPIVPLSNRDMGFLPGDIQSKLNPYMQPLHDNLGVIQNQFSESDSRHSKIKELVENDKLIVSPLSYIRGRSLVKIFFIVDEAQNLTPHEIKTIITRAGEDTKMIFTGDINQIDCPYLDINSNGLSYLIEKMQGQSIYAHINLRKGERSQLAELASNLL